MIMAGIMVAGMETIEVTRTEATADGGGGAIVTITLNRPEKKNAINGVMWDELLTTFREIAAAATTGWSSSPVPAARSAPGPICPVEAPTPASRSQHPLAAMRHVGDVALALHRLPQPTIAKVGGVAAGAGGNMAFGCDLIVASDEARFTEIFARRGLSIDFGGSWVLPRLVGLHQAKELAFFADIISAKEAEALGVVNRVVPAGELDAFVDDWAARLALGPPIALAQTKRLLNNAMEMTLEQALDDEGSAQTVNFATADTAEAMAAFLDKRDPRFEGR